MAAIALCLAVAAVAMASLPSPSPASRVWVVGGEKGWTLPSRANLDYQQWASSILPQLGDSLDFNYSPARHNVLEVIRSHYRLCNASNPLAVFNGGKTVVKLTSLGSYYFICGVPGHCDQGQKFMIRVEEAVTPAIAPALAPAAAVHQPPATAPSGEELLPPAHHAVAPTTGSATAGTPSFIPLLAGVVVAVLVSALPFQC